MDVVDELAFDQVLEHFRVHGPLAERLRGHGVSFALDDFGAGHTALHYLRDFRFDILKIDGRFVRDIEGDPHTVVGIGLPLLREMFVDLGVRWTDLWAMFPPAD